MGVRNTFDKILTRIDRDSGDCWIWTGCLSKAGYGITAYQGKNQLVHRLVYTGLGGSIPDGYHLDHLCRVPRCCNPSHLEPVPASVNVGRGELGFALTGYCRKGLHKTTEPGSVTVNKTGGRRCTQCQTEYNRQYWTENRHRYRGTTTEGETR